MSTKDGGPAFPVHEVFLANEFKPLDKFLSRIDAGDWSPDRCWNWSGAKTPDGYGVFAPAKRKQYRAHRLAMALYLGRAPTQYVLHRCDNRLCVNPHHLEEGTHGDNMRQMVERRRAAREERHHKAKLSFHEAACISLLARSGDYSTRELARLFGISQATAASVATGSLWPDAYDIADAMLAAREAK